MKCTAVGDLHGPAGTPLFLRVLPTGVIDHTRRWQRQDGWMEWPSPCLQPPHRGLAQRNSKQLFCDPFRRQPRPVCAPRRGELERALHCMRPPVFRPCIQRFLRVTQFGLRLVQLQFSVEAFTFCFRSLGERFLCLDARFEELRAQTVDEHGGFCEQRSCQRFPVHERLRHQSAAAEAGKARFAATVVPG
jgi:hypothetical protein